MSLRKSSETDLDRLIGLFDQLRHGSSSAQDPIEIPRSSRELFALHMAANPDGAIVAEEGNDLQGAAFSCLWGRTGWVGPLGVDPQHQGIGVGSRLLEEVIQSLQGAGATVIGTELPVAEERAVGFLLRRGFRPHPPTLVMEKKVIDEGVPENTPEPTYFSSLMEEKRGEFLDDVRSLSASMDADLDYTAAVEQVDATRMGESLILREAENPVGLAICHTRSYVSEGEPELLRVPVLCLNEASPHPTLDKLLAVVGLLARETRADRIRIPVPGRCWEAVRYLLERGFRVAGTRQRMTLMGYPDRSDASRINLARWG